MPFSGRRGPGKNFIELCSFFMFTDTAKLFKFGNKLITHMNVFITEFGYAWAQTSVPTLG